MALGAQRTDVIRLVLRESMLLVVIGIASGLGAALVSTRLIAVLLFGLAPNDPVTISLATVVLLAIAAFASWLPAHRASRVDPLIALRHE